MVATSFVVCEERSKRFTSPKKSTLLRKVLKKIGIHFSTLGTYRFSLRSLVATLTWERLLLRRQPLQCFGRIPSDDGLGRPVAVEPFSLVAIRSRSVREWSARLESLLLLCRWNFLCSSLLQFFARFVRVGRTDSPQRGSLPRYTCNALARE